MTRATTRAPSRPGRLKRLTDCSRQSWSREAESASLGMRDPLLAEASRNYELLGPVERMRLAREIAVSRGAELTLAYHNVVLVSAGFRKRRENGVETLTREPCVIFIVRRKRRSRRPAAGDFQFLPALLLAYADHASGRVLVAVPTDVQMEAPYAAARAQADRAIHVQDPAHRFEEYGTLTALLTLSAPVGTSVLGLTPLHVTSPLFSADDGAPLAGARIRKAQGIPQAPGAPVVGSASRMGGRLVPGPDISFDAQLLAVPQASTIRGLLDGLPLSATEPVIASMSRYDELTLREARPPIEIVLADNHPQFEGGRPRLFVEPAGTAGHAFPLPYGNAGGELMMVHHWTLLHLQCPPDMETANGDSGAPVVMWFDDGSCSFLGMHIAGQGRLAHVIPSWALLFTGSYGDSLPLDSTLALLRT